MTIQPSIVTLDGRVIHDSRDDGVFITYVICIESDHPSSKYLVAPNRFFLSTPFLEVFAPTTNIIREDSKFRRMPLETGTAPSVHEESEPPESLPSDDDALLTQDPEPSSCIENDPGLARSLQPSQLSLQCSPKPELEVLAEPSSSQGNFIGLQNKRMSDDSGSVRDSDDQLGSQSLQESANITSTVLRNSGHVYPLEAKDNAADKASLDIGNHHSQGSVSHTMVTKEPHAHCHDVDAYDEHQDDEQTGNQLTVEQPMTQIFHTENHAEATNSGIDCAQDDVYIADDSESEVWSSSSEDTSTELEGLTELRQRKVARNQTMMEQLGLVQSVKPNAPKRLGRKKRKESFMDSRVGAEGGCVLGPGTMRSCVGSEDVALKYPGREPQIRLVKSILHATIAQLDCEDAFIPPPLFISGPGGTCKTAIIRDIVQSLCSPRIASAYVNCATIEPSSIQTLVESAYRQIARTFESRKKDNTSQERKTSQLSMSNMALCVESELNETIEDDLEDRVELAISQICANDSNGEQKELTGEGSPAGIPGEHDLLSQWQANGHRTTGDHVTLFDACREDDEEADASLSFQRLSSRTRSSRQSKATDQGTRPAFKQNRRTVNVKDDDRTSTSASNHGAPLAFARSLVPFIGEHGAGSAFLILDCAERLMKFNPNQTSATTKTNYLAQLLLLPKVLELKLTIIAISRSTLLMHSRKSTLLELPFNVPFVHSLFQRH